MWLETLFEHHSFAFTKTPSHQSSFAKAMAQTQDISVARAVFISALLRSERSAPEISRDDATLFAKALLKTCNICTTSNIKVCEI